MRASEFDYITNTLAEAGRDFHRRGWVSGTSGNFSAVLGRDPLQIAITASGRDKGSLDFSAFLVVGESGGVVSGTGKPSAETALHLAILRQRPSAAAVLHTHSVWATILSDYYAAAQGIVIEGYEMLKGLSGVTSHQHREWIPIIENSQDYARLSDELSETLIRHLAAHGVLLLRHGLYTWGKDAAEARRHVEILEFLLEVAGRTLCIGR